MRKMEPARKRVQWKSMCLAQSSRFNSKHEKKREKLRDGEGEREKEQVVT